MSDVFSNNDPITSSAALERDDDSTYNDPNEINTITRPSVLGTDVPSDPIEISDVNLENNQTETLPASSSTAADRLGISSQQVENQTTNNVALLQSLELMIKEILTGLEENDSLLLRIETMVRTLRGLQAQCDADIKRLKEVMERNIPDDIKKEYEIQIDALKNERASTTTLIKQLSMRMVEINNKVKEQSRQLENITNVETTTNNIVGGSKKPITPNGKIKKIKSMKRADLDKLAKEWGVNSKQYPKKADITNALQLLAYAKMFKLEKLPKWQLVVLAKNYNTCPKTKKELVSKLEKKLASVKI